MHWSGYALAVVVGIGFALPGILQGIMAYQDARDRSRREGWEERHR